MSSAEAPLRVMSGIRSTHRLHIGNYFGALKNWLDLQHKYECYFGVMDWHAMTSSYKNPKDVAAWTRDIAAEVLAWGLDPKKVTFFIQSKVPEHIHLHLFFTMLTPMGWLERVNTWKDAEAEAKANDTHNLGRFSYPVLQTADIAIYKGNKVPVGQDQIAHLEISREIVRRCNHLYGTSLPEPGPLLTDTPMIQGTDGRKMSKSYGNYFPLTQEADELQTNLRNMPTDPARVKRTDPGDPQKCPVFSYHKLFSPQVDQEWATQGCVTAGIGCMDCKKKLGGNINSLMEKPRELKKQLLQDPKHIDSIIAEGCQRARTEAQKTLTEIRATTGFEL